MRRSGRGKAASLYVQQTSEMAASCCSDDKLAPFVLSGVKGLEKECDEAGHGAYGVIYNVTVNGLPCVAKRLHKALVRQVHNSEDIKKKFRTECITLSRLKHSNIVHFVGVHYDKDKELTLIMECLPSDLACFLENYPLFPLSLKLSILLDISCGLLYLHTRDPLIVHRDLTARNVLISDDYRAKIADLGVAKLLTPQDLMDVNYKNTKAPGAPLYMPPEVLTENPECTPKIDIFSFGHLSLFTINQEDPRVNLDIPQATEMQGGIEVLKRKSALENIGRGHCMYSLITQCLNDSPANRPNAVELKESVKSLCMQHLLEDIAIQVKGNKELTAEVDRIHQLSKDQSRQVQDLATELDKLREHFKNQSRTVLQMKEHVDGVKKDLNSAHSELETAIKQKEAVERELTIAKQEAAQDSKEFQDKLIKISKFAEIEAESELKMRSTIITLGKENTELKCKLEAVQIQVNEETLTRQRQQLEKQVIELQSTVETLQAEKIGLVEKLRKMGEEQDSLEHSKIADLEKELKQCKTNIQAVLEESTAHAERNLMELTKLKTRCEQLDNQNIELQRQLEAVAMKKIQKEQQPPQEAHDDTQCHRYRPLQRFPSSPGFQRMQYTRERARAQSDCAPLPSVIKQTKSDHCIPCLLSPASLGQRQQYHGDQIPNLQSHDGCPQADSQGQLQRTPQVARPHTLTRKDHQQPFASIKPDTIHRAETQQSPQRPGPICRQQSGGKPPVATPRVRKSVHPSPSETVQSGACQEAPRLKTQNLKESDLPLSDSSVSTVRQTSHGNQVEPCAIATADSITSHMHQVVAQNSSQQSAAATSISQFYQKKETHYANFEVFRQIKQPLSQRNQASTCTTAPTVEPYPKLQTDQPSSPAARFLDEGSTCGSANDPTVDIDDEIKIIADEVREEVSTNRECVVTDTDRPYDPNLVCPMCNKPFRIGEIQKFRAHVNQCEGKTRTPGPDLLKTKSTISESLV